MIVEKEEIVRKGERRNKKEKEKKKEEIERKEEIRKGKGEIERMYGILTLLSGTLSRADLAIKSGLWFPWIPIWHGIQTFPESYGIQGVQEISDERIIYFFDF